MLDGLNYTPYCREKDGKVDERRMSGKIFCNLPINNLGTSDLKDVW